MPMSTKNTDENILISRVSLTLTSVDCVLTIQINKTFNIT